jgi:hypothetical protein
MQLAVGLIGVSCTCRLWFRVQVAKTEMELPRLVVQGVAAYMPDGDQAFKVCRRESG